MQMDVFVNTCLHGRLIYDVRINNNYNLIIRQQVLAVIWFIS